MPSIINATFFLKHYTEIKRLFIDRGFNNAHIAVEERGKISLYVNNVVEDGLGKITSLQTSIIKLCNDDDVVASSLGCSFLNAMPPTALKFDDWILLEAARYGNVDVVKQAVANGVSINTKAVDGFTPTMIFAAAGDHLPVMEYLWEELGKHGWLTATSLLDAQNVKGYTALHVSAYCGHMKATEWLLNHGAKRDVENDGKKTAAQITKKPEIASLIQSLGASVDQPASSSGFFSSSERNRAVPSETTSTSSGSVFGDEELPIFTENFIKFLQAHGFDGVKKPEQILNVMQAYISRIVDANIIDPKIAKTNENFLNALREAKFGESAEMPPFNVY